MNKFEYKNLTPFKWFVLENFPFIEADFDALTEWQLFCKLGKEMNKIINSTNTLGTQVETLTDFVSNYFDNLDVQEEINNKLNNMVEDGTLQEIITNYLQIAGILAFNTVQDMKEATNLINGSFVKTLGYYSLNDRGSATYKIREITNQDAVDGAFIIALNNLNLVAELILEDNMNLKQFGGKCNGNDDDSTFASVMLNKCGYLDLGGFNTVLQNLTLPNNSIIKNGIIKVLTNGTVFTGNNLTSFLLDNIEFKATFHKNNPAFENNLINFYDSKNITIKNSKINECACGFNFVNCENIIAHDNEITGTSRFAFNFGTDNYIFGFIKNVQFFNNFMHDNPYIPLKFTGYIENIDVFNNTGFNNLDSEETACFSFKNVKIHDNVFSNDTNRNIGFKQLDFTEYPLPEDAPQTLYSEDLEIYNNSCKNGNHNGINIQLYYNHNTDAIRIHDNTVDSIGTDDYTGIRIGVFNSNKRDACKIYNNFVNLNNIGGRGILLQNANNVELANNTVLDCKEACIGITYQNTFYEQYNVKVDNITIINNKLESLNTPTSRCVIFYDVEGSDINTDITNISILKNNFNVNSGANQIQGNPTNTLLSQNYDGVNLYDNTPTRRSANYTIYFAKNPDIVGSVGWIATGRYCFSNL